MSVGSGNPGMLECNHEEADTRIVVHIVQQGMKRIEVRTVDTDVIAILAGAYFKLALACPLGLLPGRERSLDYTASITFVPALVN